MQPLFVLSRHVTPKNIETIHNALHQYLEVFSWLFYPFFFTQFFYIFRYCLDGPVIFTDEVIWFCEDCEAELIDTDYHDKTTDSENGEVDSNKECLTVIDPQPIADAIWR
jgi:hypothetical protein